MIINIIVEFSIMNDFSIIINNDLECLDDLRFQIKTMFMSYGLNLYLFNNNKSLFLKKCNNC